jgi:hypothetical protein
MNSYSNNNFACKPEWRTCRKDPVTLDQSSYVNVLGKRFIRRVRPMSGEGFDQRETLGVAAALNRCRTLVAQIENALARYTPLRDTASLAEVHAALNHAAELLKKEAGSAGVS